MRKHPALIALPAALLCSQAVAIPGNLVAGNQLSTGAVTLFESTPSLAHNPALLFKALGSDDIQVNGLKLPAFAIELGELDEDFVASLDQLEANIDCAEDDTRSYADRQTCANAINGESGIGSLMKDLAKGAKMNLDMAMPVPALPVVFRAFGGFMAVNLEASAGIGMRVLNSNTVAVLDPVAEDVTVEDDTAVYLKSAVFAQLGVAYSQKVFDLPADTFGQSAELYAGGRLHIIQGKLSRQIAVVQNENDNSDESAFDRVGDNYDLNEVSSSAVSLDVGLGMIGSTYTAGLQIRNLLPPEFDFGNVGQDCGQLAEPQRTDCAASQQYTDASSAYANQGGVLVPGSEKYKLDTQLVLEGSYNIADSDFVTFGSLELNAAENINGVEYQWMHLGVGYNGPWWIPSLRLGYRSNLASGGMDVITLGVNLFNFLAIEAFQATDTAEFDGDEYPRSAGVSVGLTTYF